MSTVPQTFDKLKQLDLLVEKLGEDICQNEKAALKNRKSIEKLDLKLADECLQPLKFLVQNLSKGDFMDDIMQGFYDKMKETNKQKALVRKQTLKAQKSEKSKAD